MWHNMLVFAWWRSDGVMLTSPKNALVPKDTHLQQESDFLLLCYPEYEERVIRQARCLGLPYHQFRSGQFLMTKLWADLTLSEEQGCGSCCAPHNSPFSANTVHGRKCAVGHWEREKKIWKQPELCGGWTTWAASWFQRKSAAPWESARATRC